MGFVDGLSSIAGFNKKAVLEIGSFEDIKVEKIEADKPNKAGSLTKFDTGKFDQDALEGFAKSIKLTPGEGYELHGQLKTYRFEVQFNPDEIYINGYGGEELPIQNYEKKNGSEGDKNKEPGEKKILGGSNMASANTRIDMNFKLVFDKSNPQDAFYSDKFTLSQTNIAKGIGRAAMGLAGKNSTSVQPEIEALTSIVRSGKKSLVKFVWGDMSYEGILNTVSAEYVMFNINGEPCRAFVSMGMVLYDEDVGGAYTNIWKNTYNNNIYSIRNSLGMSLDVSSS